MTQPDRDRLVVLKKTHKKLITRDRAVIHGRRDRSSNRILGEDARSQAVMVLSPDVYRGFGPTLATKYLAKNHNLTIGPRGSAAAHDPSRSVAWPAESRSHPRMASASKLARRARAVEGSS